MIKFSRKENQFLQENEVCRIATVFRDMPHVVPICYIYLNNSLYFATDYNTKKYNNILHNNHISIIVDVYDTIEGNKAVLIDGLAYIIEDGEEFKQIYSLFEKKFKWVRDDPWKEGEAPFIKVVINKKVSWGL
ncbi:MAG: pyridoxamine 5'-phosphate oxidase family protein [Nitrososphaeraceae archaeon]|nr:pyridoxamine 5'-phosphate oxidase family protein [Nitrososphaeraceae archaeon]